jgi:small-conductance mechanosensitive channel
MGCGVTVGVVYGSDPAHVEKVLLEAAHDAVRDGVEGLLAMPEPGVRFNPGFGDSSLNFTLGVNIRQFTDQFLVQSELRKRIVKRFGEAGIQLALPTRTLVFDKSAKELLGDNSKG